ncbi:hypothetical protein [Streptomyces olivaceiscleroticus]|uniref:Tetratricopeptide repeat protein n=1 Tax=Streptomyces olivaceiscleroticus TaxID=68245 RepID=A0ABN0ZAS4_9ACTN
MRHLWWGTATRTESPGWEDETYRRALEAVERHDMDTARRRVERLLRVTGAAPASCSGTVARALYLMAGLDAAEGLLFTARSRYAASAAALEGARERAERDGDDASAAMLAEFRDLARAVAADLTETCGVDGQGPDGRWHRPPREPAGAPGQPIRTGAGGEGSVRCS